jgi:hypothetical protein
MGMRALMPIFMKALNPHLLVVDLVPLRTDHLFARIPRRFSHLGHYPR